MKLGFSGSYCQEANSLPGYLLTIIFSNTSVPNPEFRKVLIASAG